jgi:hypothetical protein
MHCPYCGKDFQASGKVTRCPFCDTQMEIALPLKTEAQKNRSFDPLLWVGYIGAACGVLLLLEAELAGSEFFLFPLAMIVILILIVGVVALASVQESAK